jgi:phospholipid/cholesterol/gamma-HCH transport system substrate-binding protein
MPGNRVVAVGIFVVCGVLLFAVGLFFIGDRRMLFNSTFDVYAEFSNIAALQNGGVVRVGGMGAGEVKEIKVPASPSGRFRVKMRVREDLHQLIRLDSVASIQNDGLVGNKFVQIEVGTDQAAIVPRGGTVRSEEPFDLAVMFKKMNATIDLVTVTITDVQKGVSDALTTISATVQGAQELINATAADLKSITASTQKVAEDLNAIVAGVRQGRGTVGKLVTDDSLFTSVKAISAQAEKVVANMRDASQQAKDAIAEFRGAKGPVKGLSGQFQQTLSAARETLADLAENAEALKHNFLFRGFFNRRGFFDLDDVTVQQYRQGALQTKERRVLKIWIKAEYLFEKDETGQERLSETGRLRLDSAMSQFVRYPKSSPLVAEGYASAPTADERFLRGRARAQLVRAYVVAKFGNDPNYVGAMALGSEAPDSPSGTEWDGIALALFVATSAL